MATTATQQPTAAPVAVPAPTNPVGAPAPVPAGPVTQPPPGTTVNRPQVSASLYIGDLDPEVGESALYDLFKEIGNVASIRVCRDAISRVSLGYAYVNFHSVESAERAISVLNGALLNNRPCRIMWSRRDPSIRKSGVGNIFIKNLSPTVDHANLYDIFSTFGNIHSCKLVTNKAGQSRGYGFVHFHTKESADMAIKKMNNLKVNGKQVYVAPFISSRDRQRINPNDVYTNVYIKNIDENVTQEEFQKHFEQFGSITSAKLMNTEEKTKTRFGFVNYMTHDQAVRCVTETNNSEFHGKTLFAARAQSRVERSEELRKRREERANKYQGVNLYIKNIDDSVDEEKLRKAFAEFGAITSVKIMTNDKGLSKGFGFVCFSKPEEATKALTKMNNVMLENKPLYVALAQRKEQRRAQLEAQYAQRTNIRMNQPGAGMGITPPMYAGPMFYPQVAAANQNRAFMYGPQMTQPFRGNRAPFNSSQQGAGFGTQHVGFPVTAAQGQSVRARGNSNNPGRGVAQGRNPGQQPGQPQQGRVPQAQPGQQPPQQPQQGNRKNQPNVKNPPSPSTGRNSAQDDAQANPKEQLANLLFEQVANAHHQDVAEKIVEHLVSNHSENELQQFLDEKDRLDQAATEALKVI